MKPRVHMKNPGLRIGGWGGKLDEHLKIPLEDQLESREGGSLGGWGRKRRVVGGVEITES